MKTLFSSRFVLAVAAVLAIAPLQGRAADPIEINAILATTGSFAFVGKDDALALTVAEAAVNAAGGIRGRPIKFVVYDDQSNPQVAVQLANRLLAAHVPVMIGPSPASACNAVAPLVKDDAVMFCTSAAFHPAPNSYDYAAGVATTGNVAFMARYLLKRGLVKVGSINSSDASGQDFDRVLAGVLSMPENKSLTLVDSQHFSPTELNIDGQMAHLKASGAQVILSGNAGALLGIIFHAYTDLGLTVPVIGTGVVINNATLSQFAPILPKEFLATGQPSDAPDARFNRAQSAAVRAFMEAFKQAGVTPDHSVSVPWDPVMIIIAALRQFGPDATAPQISGFIHNLHGWYGAAGEYDFRGGNQTGLDGTSQVMLRWEPQRKSWVAAS